MTLVKFITFLTIFFLFLPIKLPAKNYDFSNYTGCNDFSKITKKTAPPSFAITKTGSHLTFLPYSGIIRNKNIMTFLKPQTPVLVTAEDINQRFYFVESELAKGFILRENVIFVDEEVFKNHLQSQKGLLKKVHKIDDLTLPIATKLPIIAKKKGRYKVRIYKPEVADIWLTAKEFTETMPLNNKNLKKIATLFRKKPYSWGNSESGWDCSGLLVDYFSFFDVSLPRNSYQQINSVKMHDLTDKTIKEKERIIKKSKPFLTLLYFPGHIMLYTGKKGKELMTFQALNRIGEKKYGYVDFFPLKKNGLLSRVTKVGFIESNRLNLTLGSSAGKI